MKHPLLQIAALTLAVAFAPAAHAARLLKVGSGNGCSHATLQSALDEARDGVGDYIVRITRSLSYTNVHAVATINSARTLLVEGGGATCTSGTDSTNTVLNGSGTSGPVISMNVATGGLVHLSRLELRGGKGGDGGGVFFKGDGILEVSDSFITQNTATHGGGILARGTGSNAELVIGANVTISNNSASGNGGGIYADQLEMTMTDPGSILLLNHADNGYGGGLYIHSGALNSYAYVGSSGVGNLGAIWGNTARYGGGVAIGGENSNHGAYRTAELRLFSTDAAHRGKIAGNFASVAGGAIHAKSLQGGLFDGSVYSSAKLWNAELEGNSAPQGGAVYLEGEFIPDLSFNVENATTPWQPGALRCGVGADCGRIVGNTAQDGAGQFTDSAILAATDEGIFTLGPHRISDALSKGGIVVEGNRGGRFIDTTNRAEIANVLIDGNQFSKELIRAYWITLHDTTIAGNTIGAAQLLQGTGHSVEIKRSILWQPGLITLQRSGGTMAVDHVIASEINSIGGNFGGGGDCGGGVCAILADPRFVDPAHGDFSLRARSPAIDASPAIAGDDRDAFGNPRDRDLPFTWADNGVRDIGAIERQSLAPLVLNGDFDYSDLRLWRWTAGAWDGTQNKTGGAGSGSWKFTYTPPSNTPSPPRFDVGEQCILLPGPARYLMNGWGRSAGSLQQGYDKAVLAWEYRRNSTNDCGGAITASGELTLGSGSNWAQAASPASIDATEADFTVGGPSIKLRLVAIHGGMSAFGSTTAWFDGITLDATSLNDVIFKNGFE